MGMDDYVTAYRLPCSDRHVQVSGIKWRRLTEATPRSVGGCSRYVSAMTRPVVVMIASQPYGWDYICAPYVVFPPGCRRDALTGMFATSPPGNRLVWLFDHPLARFLSVDVSQRSAAWIWSTPRQERVHTSDDLYIDASQAVSRHVRDIDAPHPRSYPNAAASGSTYLDRVPM